MRNRVGLIIATAGGSGYFPIAPGTIGSAVGVLVFLAVRAAGAWWFEAAALVTTLVVGAWASTVAEEALERKDPGPVVIDEVLGMLATMIFVPLSVATVAAGFLLFRVFDVLKPFPANRLERVPRGWGIMLDDLAAGVYANLVLQALVWFRPGGFA
ncbi:MAG: phosphatidylglycerophosphatase A [Vicinamibacterales bacterium]|nr:phosphatidylglycerophosphatase A [Vicinamibacterales bacterium]